jgi:hypothetical protein
MDVQAGADPRTAFEVDGYVRVLEVPTKRGVAPLVLFGPAGAFVVDTVDWAGRFHRGDSRLMFEGGEAERLTHSLLRRALEVKRRLLADGVDVHVEAILVATEGTLVASSDATEPWGIAFDYVTVLLPEDVRPFLVSRTPRHSPDDVASARAALEAPPVRQAHAANA